MLYNKYWDPLFNGMPGCDSTGNGLGCSTAFAMHVSIERDNAQELFAVEQHGLRRQNVFGILKRDDDNAAGVTWDLIPTLWGTQRGPMKSREPEQSLAAHKTDGEKQ